MEGMRSGKGGGSSPLQLLKECMILWPKWSLANFWYWDCNSHHHHSEPWCWMACQVWVGNASAEITKSARSLSIVRPVARCDCPTYLVIKAAQIANDCPFFFRSWPCPRSSCLLCSTDGRNAKTNVNDSWFYGSFRRKLFYWLLKAATRPSRTVRGPPGGPPPPLPPPKASKLLFWPPNSLVRFCCCSHRVEGTKFFVILTESLKRHYDDDNHRFSGFQKEL